MTEWRDSRRERGEGERKKEERGKRKKRGRERVRNMGPTVF